MRIAISGKSGCGNTTVSKMTAEALGYRMVNYTFHTLAEELDIPFDKLCDMAEKDPQWDRMLDKKQVELSRDGDVVLGSRLAIWLLEDADLKVFLTASPEIRAARIQKREGGELETVLARTLDRDRRDRNRYLKLYGIDNNDYSFADLIIDTEQYSQEEEVKLIIRHLTANPGQHPV
ncbi:MAG: (d)CMP kinase [Spirochaetia bacterium]